MYNFHLPWVNSAIYLGHLISQDGNSKHDILRRRGEFISKVHELRQELGDQHPDVFTRLVQMYLTSMYGSNLWNLFGEAAGKLYSAWSMLIKNTYHLPHATHRYLLFNISDVTHLKVALAKRFVKFYNYLEKCEKQEILFLFTIQKSDVRSTFGYNCFKFCQEFEVNSVKEINPKNISMFKIPVEEEWRLPIFLDLLRWLISEPYALIPKDLNYISLYFRQVTLFL